MDEQMDGYMHNGKGFLSSFRAQGWDHGSCISAEKDERWAFVLLSQGI
jgi:hypothetical protein